MHASRYLIALIFLTASINSFAYCLGGGGLSTCYDSSGNSYTISRLGSTTIVQGSNANTGNAWSETTNRFGNVTSINGNSANGSNWNETITNLGGGNFTESGLNSQGQYFSKFCTPYGCN